MVAHIVRKDFQYLRYYLAGWLGLVILRAAVIGYGPLDSGIWDFSTFNFYEVLAWFPQICLLLVIVSRLVQDDALVGSTAFWLGRPITGRQLLLGKSLFLALFVIFPLFVVELLLLSFHGVTLRDVFRSIPQILALELLLLSVLLLVAALTRNLVRVALLGLIGPIGWMSEWEHCGGRLAARRVRGSRTSRLTGFVRVTRGNALQQTWAPVRL